MKLLNQRVKNIMEDCKVKAKEAGLSFGEESTDETLEYLVTNRDMIELSPKVMIPTLYDYWVHDLEVIKGEGKYKVFPSNPYETVINTRPAISFYNDNNTDWLNVMIFYHVIAHVDFFRNNTFFKKTWDYDFTNKALADKRLIANLRLEKGRWVDYVIEFSRGMDNLVGFYEDLNSANYKGSRISKKVDFYFDVFLQKVEKVNLSKYLEEIDRYNSILNKPEQIREGMFFADIKQKYPEFQSLYEKEKKKNNKKKDVMQFISDNSPFLNAEHNKWMKLVLNVVRDTSLYFQPQIRTKITNEGWASYWHDKLFRQDERLKGHESAFSKVNSGVMSLSRVGLNPYAIGWRLLLYAEDLMDKGKLSYDFELIKDRDKRKDYDQKTGKGRDFLFKIREEFNDFSLINYFVDQDFVDKHNLFVVGKRLDPFRGVWQYYVKSRKAEDYKKMLIDSLYHPPYVTVDEGETKDGELYLNHHFEGKQLIQDFIPMTLLGIEQLWGGPVKLETSVIDGVESEDMKRMAVKRALSNKGINNYSEEKFKFKRIVYTMKNKSLTKRIIG